MTTAWHQQYRGLRARGIQNPDPRQRFFSDLGQFLMKIHSDGSDYTLGMDFCDHDDIQDFLPDHDMVDGFSDFMEERPATQFRGSEQIDLISISRRLSPYIQKAYILDPNNSKGDHSTIGIDFDFGLLISNRDLSDIEPGHIQDRTLVSTDVKASKKFLELIKKKNLAHNIPYWMNALYDRCERTGRCSDVDQRVYQTLCKDLYANGKQAEAECKRVG
jgi:hypothetical protein